MGPVMWSLDGEPVTIDELKTANPEGVGVSWETIEAMKPGEKMLLGGGAWATFELECLGPEPTEPPDPALDIE